MFVIRDTVLPVPDIRDTQLVLGKVQIRQTKNLWVQKRSSPQFDDQRATEDKNKIFSASW